MDSFLIDKKLPVAIEMEIVVLGALILDENAFSEVSELLNPNCFYELKHRLVFEAIKTLHDNNKPVDLVSVTRQLKDRGDMSIVGGASAVTKLTSPVASSANIVYHARVLHQKYLQRELIRISAEINSKAFDSSEDVSDLITTAQSKIADLESSTSTEGLTCKEVAAISVAEMESDCARIQSGLNSGIATGFVMLNKIIGGWKSNMFSILAARPGGGKTSLALFFAVEAAKAGHWVNFYSYEMSSSDMFKIIIAGKSEVRRNRIRDGYLTEEDWQRIHMSISDLERLPIIWHDDPTIKASTIKANTNKNKRRGRCELVIVDYVQLIPPEDNKSNREQQIAEISRILKRITLIHKLPVLANAQLNREVERRSSPEPFKSDLRESGTLEQDADVVLFPYVEDEKRYLKIAKNRRGKEGKIEILSNAENTCFYDAPSEGEDYEGGYTPSWKIPPGRSFYEKDEDVF